MNDFTKEELELIHQYLRGNPRTYGLAKKIQSMIDNYYEHDNLKDVGAKYKVCSLCGEEVYDNK